MIGKLLVLLIFIPQLVFAADSEQIAQKISETTMSPFCPGRTISSCPSSEARNLRDKIIDWLDHGYSEQAVRNQLTMIYGKEVTGRPDFYGFGLMAWIVPSLFVLLGLLTMSIWLRRSRNKSSQFVKQGEGQQTKFNDLIQAELSNRLR